MLPVNDPFWIEVAKFIQDNRLGHSKVAAPNEFQLMVSNCFDCLSINLDDDFQWFVFHKGWANELSADLIDKVMTQMKPVHGNPVFITFSNQQNLPILPTGNVHLAALLKHVGRELQDSMIVASKLQMPAHVTKVICNEMNEKISPTLERPVSQLCTASQFYSSEYERWADEMLVPVVLHRKQWEFVYILSVLNSYGKLNAGVSGLGFGCGKEPIASVMAKYGCKILLSDLDLQDASQKGWVSTNEHSAQLRDLHNEGVCDWEVFKDNASFMTIDMNDIPVDLPKVDFIWSACALEHLGSLQHGIDFIIKSSHYLKPGGIAVHTTEYNLSSNEKTINSENLCFYRKKDIEKLAKELSINDFDIIPVNFFCGDRVEDGFIDVPPYYSDIHLKLLVSTFVSTSIGLIVHNHE
jgi:2-polyprenyl-3-methyl-5-hydroxy-6-metoxy-1,4-benzoquinol methylase